MGSSDFVSGIESQFLFGKAIPCQSYTYERVMKIRICLDPYRVILISVESTAKVLNTKVKAGPVVVRNKMRENGEESSEQGKILFITVDENCTYTNFSLKRCVYK